MDMSVKGSGEKTTSAVNEVVAQRNEWDLPKCGPDIFDLDHELQNNPELRKSDLTALTEWASSQNNLPPLAERDIVKFLHSGGYDIAAAQHCIRSYYASRKKTPEIFTGRDIRLPNLQSQLDCLYFAVFPQRTPEGYRIFYNKLRLADPDKYEFVDHIKVLCMTLDACLLAEPTVPGFVFIWDLELGTLSHFWKFNIWLQRKIFSYFENGMPLYLKATLILNTPSYIKKVMSVLSAFAKKENLDKSQFFTGDYHSELHKIIPKEYLPSDLGGTLPSLEELHALNTARLDSLREYFLEEENVFATK